MTNNIKTTIYIFKLTCLFCALIISSKSYSQVFTNSNLPIVKINTLGNSISDDPKVLAHISVINNVGQNYVTDAANDLVAYIGIETRGSSSQFFFPKKSYGLELRDSLNNNNAISKKFLGMPAESDWILYAPYTDKTFLRDVLTYTLSNKMDNYATRCKFVELIIDSVYQGIYVVQEKIKRDSNRVNIAKLSATDVSGADITGGYILKIDKNTGTFNGGFYSSVGTYLGNPKTTFFQYDYPKNPNMQQQNYIAAYIDSFETALLSATWKDSAIGYKKYINTNSFIDFFLLNELSHNVDGYRLSTYMHKKKITNGDGKLHLGPIWDFNLGYQNADYCDGWRADSWAYQQPCNPEFYPFWWDRLLLDTAFANKLKCRYVNLRSNVLSDANIFSTIDSLVNQIGPAAVSRNYNKWPIIGTYVWPNYLVANSYNEEIDALKSWITLRLNWMDAYMPGMACGAYPTSNTHLLPANNLSLYPTVCKNYFNLGFANANSFYNTIEIYSTDGKLLQTKIIKCNATENKVTVDVSFLASGYYFVICKNDKKITNTFSFIKQ